MIQTVWTKESREKYAYSKEERRKYYREHSERIIKQNNDWAKNHREQVNAIMRNYYRTHKEDRERRKKHFEKWMKEHPDKCKEYSKKHTYKRRRELGYIPLNEPFVNSEAHHIDCELVVYIPKELHHSVYHNIRTGLGMTEINDRVFEWLTEHGLTY